MDLAALLNDLRYSARSLARSPAFALALLTTIALGIGSNVTIYGFIRGLTPRNVPVLRTNRAVLLFASGTHHGSGALSYDEYLSLKKRVDAFEWIGCARIWRTEVTFGGRPAVICVAALTPELAHRLHLSLDGGVVVSHGVWEGELGARPRLDSKKVRMAGLEARIVGVAPDGLRGLFSDRAIGLWIPLHEQSVKDRDRSVKDFWVIGGLHPGVSTAQVEEAVRAGRVDSGAIHAVPFRGISPAVAEDLSRVDTLLRVAAGLIFFVACANVASFLLGRAAARWRQTSIRVALGAGRGRLTRAVLAESAVISFGGGALGVLLGMWTSKIVPAFLFEQDAEFLVLAPGGFSALAAAAAGGAIIFVCGLLPVLETPHDRPAAVLLRESAGPSRVTRLVCAGLAIGQMASCCLLLIATSLLYEGFRAALKTDIGHRLGEPFLASVHADPITGINYFRKVEHALKSVAGVSPIAWAGRPPASQPAWQSFRVEPRRLPLRAVTLDVAGFPADPFTLFVLPPRAGRLFGFGDQQCRVAVVNEEAAQTLFGDDTVGRTVYDAAGNPVEIIGVVAARKRSPSTLKRRPTVYFDSGARSGPDSGRVALAGFRAPVRSKLDSAELDMNVVSPSYFTAMGLSLVAGRIFPVGSRAPGCRVGVVNQEAADLFFGGNAVGAAVIDDTGRRTGIIGVVRAAQLGTFQRGTEPAVYFPMAQDCLPDMTLILGARTASGPLLADLRRTLELVPGRGPAPVTVKTLDRQLGQSALAPLRVATVTIGASATIALLLSLLGLYGTLSNAAQRRRRELAVRVTLGARRRDVILQVLREAARLAGAGTLVGMLASIVVAQWLSRLGADGGWQELWVWLVGPAILFGAAALASVLPARRALMVDPLDTLRNEG